MAYRAGGCLCSENPRIPRPPLFRFRTSAIQCHLRASVLPFRNVLFFSWKRTTLAYPFYRWPVSRPGERPVRSALSVSSAHRTDAHPYHYTLNTACAVHMKINSTKFRRIANAWYLSFNISGSPGALWIFVVRPIVAFEAVTFRTKRFLCDSIGIIDPHGYVYTCDQDDNDLKHFVWTLGKYVEWPKWIKTIWQRSIFRVRQIQGTTRWGLSLESEKIYQDGRKPNSTWFFYISDSLMTRSSIKNYKSMFEIYTDPR